MLIAVTDLETTDTDCTKGFIVEVGIAVLDTDTGEIEVVYNEICKENGISYDKIRDSWVFSHSNLRLATVMDSKNVINRRAFGNYKSIFKDVQDIFYSVHGNTAFNCDFDFKWLKSRGYTIPNQLPCLMKTMTGVCKLKRKDGDESAGYKYPKFEEAAKFAFGNDPMTYPKEYLKVLNGKNHRAGNDAAAEAALLRWMLEKPELAVKFGVKK